MNLQVLRIVGSFSVDGRPGSKLGTGARSPRGLMVYCTVPIVSIVVPFLVKPIIYLGSYKATPKRNYNGDHRYYCISVSYDTTL